MIQQSDRKLLTGWPSDGEETMSDQQKGMPRPSLQEPCSADFPRLKLPSPEHLPLPKPHILDCIRDRVSRRQFADAPLTQEQLSYLLWATQGVKRLSESGHASFRTVASAGARHPFETYLTVNKVTGLEPGRYRYLALNHELAFMGPLANMAERVTQATCGQKFCADASVTIYWSAVPYRTEWRYPDTALKVILLDAGHVMQNLYLAAESLSLGTCAIAAYDQKECDSLFGLDGQNELIVYLAPVGVPR